MGMVLFTIDMTLITTALPTIARELDAAESYQWVGTSYLLTSTALAPLWGKLSDVFGRKQLMIFNCLLFTLVSIPCALAPNIIVLIVARALQGVGGGGMQSIVFVILTEIVTMRERGKYQGFMMSLSGISAVVGPLLGGVLTQYLSWRWCFWINLPFGTLALLGYWFYIKDLSKKSSMREKLSRIDYLGSVLCITGVTLVLLGFTWSEGGWTTGQCLGPMLSGFAVLALFVAWEGYGAKEPSLPLILFRSWNFTWCIAATFCLGWVLLSQNYFLPFYFQLVRGATPTSSGLMMIPQIVSWLVGAIMIGIISSKTGRYVEFPKVGYVLMAGGIGAMAAWTADSHWAFVYCIEVVVGFGLALSITMLTVIVQAAVDPRDIGPGTTFATFARSIAGTISIAVSSAILGSVTSSTYAGQVPVLQSQYGIPPSVSSAYISSFTSGSPAPADLTSDQAAALHGATVASFQRGIQMVFAALVPFAVVGWVATMFLKHIPLATKAMGNESRKAGDKSGYGKEEKMGGHLEMA
ncbi:major facilitator superfamily domain-containing protein [Hyaloraphidium curvatum]|nr:major facilitator superfamily domain-containing protein [Hyaloraphidium curvatum]